MGYETLSQFAFSYTAKQMKQILDVVRKLYKFIRDLWSAIVTSDNLSLSFPEV